MRVSRIVLLIASALAVVFAGAAGPASAASKAPKLTKLRCVPKNAAACKGGVRVSVGDAIALSGSRIVRGQRATFRWSRGSTKAKVVRVKGAALAVKVPKKTPVGTVTLTLKDRKGRKSNAKKVKIVAPSANTPNVPGTSTSPTAPVTSTVTGAATGRNAVPAVFAGTSAWIWKLDQAEGGNVDAIIAKAKHAGLSTLFVKSYDGGDSEGSQFSRALVDKLHAGGLNVCAWQFIYGIDPAREAAGAIESIRAGADCFVINAEEQYSGRYAEAQQYLAAVRGAREVGNDYPIGFTSYGRPLSHPNMPLSVFLGPRGGAQVAMPQVYWRDFGVPAEQASREVATYWRIYGRPIVPMGQTDHAASADDIAQFRAVWQQYGAVGTSWFRWGVETPEVWPALAAPIGTFDLEKLPEWHVFSSGQNADGARWAQQLLAAFDPSIVIDGQFGPGTESVVRRFQEARGLTPTTGGTGPRTWEALLKEPYTYVDWATGARSSIG